MELIGYPQDGYHQGSEGTHLRTLTSITFDEEVGAATLPLVVDFWAEWCSPCRMVAPILAEIASEYEGKIIIAKLDVDEAPDVARRYDILTIPTLLVFSDGVLKKRLTGAKGKRQLLEEFAEFL